MKNKVFLIPLVLSAMLSLCGFKSTGEKNMSLAVIYGVAAVTSVIVFLVYIFGIRKKSPWFVLLFSSVFVVNVGYFSLSVSKSLEEALLANRISYLGSVFLPMSILMIILDITKTKYGRLFTGTLIGAGILIFLLAASPGYLDVYYKEVSFVIIDGVSQLDKVYGPLHIIYLFYLLIYFSAMITLIIIKTVKKRIDSIGEALILLASVFVNIAVWLFEQFIRLDFEILSVSYTITVLFLLCLCFLIQENEKKSLAARVGCEEDAVLPKKTELTEESGETKEAIPAESFEADKNSFNQDSTRADENNFIADTDEDFFETEEYRSFMYGLGQLTHTENIIYGYYIEGKSTKEILALLDITENTLKYHNKNIYGKLGVSSRKQLKEIAYKINNA